MIGIYKIENLVNGKIYIGQSVNINRRKQEHENKSFQISSSDYKSAIGAAIRKYGIDNFSFETIEECSIEDLDEKEKYWIQYYNSYKQGYNCTSGGTTSFSKREYPQIYQYDLEGNFIKEFANVHEAAKEMKCSSDSLYNSLSGRTYIQNNKYFWSYEKHEKITPYFVNIPVIAFTFEGNKYKVFSSILAASKETNDTVLVIKHSCDDNNYTGKYYQYRYWENNDTLLSIPPKKHYWGKTVLQYDLKGNFIQSFNSLSQAAKAVGLKSITSIKQCCDKDKKIKTAKGFLWSYYGDKPVIPKISKTPAKIVEQYDLNNHLINTFPSLRKAAESLGNVCYRAQIQLCCENKKETYQNYIWRYK